MEKLRACIVGATGMVGQRFVTLLADHPYFRISALAASASSAGREYAKAVEGRWKMSTPIPQGIGAMTVLDASDVAAVKAAADIVFCAVNMDKKAVRELEEAYARAELCVISNNSACRGLDDVPMLVPEINPAHTEVISTQRKRLGTKRGFIAVKPNCSIQSYVPAVTALMKYRPTRILATTYQAISGAGKTFETMPQIIDNVIPYIKGEEEKSEQEPLKIWGRVVDGHIARREDISITTQCLRVPVSDGHMAAVFVSFADKPSREDIIEAWKSFASPVDALALPSAPKPFIVYMEEDDRPQTRLDRDMGAGMAVCVGRLRADSQYDYKFVGLSHNTLRGAAGGGVLMAELLYRQGYLL